MGKIALFFIGLLLISCKTSENNNGSLLSSKYWIVEQQPNGKVLFSGESLEIFDDKGCTVWFNKKLEAPVVIEYDATVIAENGPFDRVSDLNCFWMANDPKMPNDLFKNSEIRKGVFKNYHELTLYYVGYGGHNNTKTRFRKYDGNMERPLLKEHDLSDPKYLIIPNKKIHIEITVKDNYISFKRNNEVVFEMNDSSPYLSGYFGFRSVENHIKIENFKIK